MATFLTYDKPLLCAMIQYPTPDECIVKIKASLAEGAEAFGIQLCQLERQYRTKEELFRIFAACCGKPIYITSYRYAKSTGYTDEECAELLLLGLEAGATLCDVVGDFFCPDGQYQLTDDPDAVAKQRALIDEIHRRGGEVLMSSHTMKSTTVEENITIAKKQAERGADVIKIVNRAESEREIPVYLEAIQKIIAETGKRVVLLVSGEGQLVRYIGPCFGACMYLCVEHHGPHDTSEQPLLRRLKAMRDNIYFR